MRKLATTGLVWCWVSVLVIALDRLTKYLVVTNLTLLEPLRVFPFFNVTLAYNTGAAFGFLHSDSGWQTTFFCTLVVIVGLFIIIWLYRLPRQAIISNLALTLILGGAIGNAWDRLLYGHVIDFFDFHLKGWHFAIFNIADCAICIGAFFLVLQWVFGAGENA
jgi:signal peptidase II